MTNRLLFLGRDTVSSFRHIQNNAQYPFLLFEWVSFSWHWCFHLSAILHTMRARNCHPIPLQMKFIDLFAWIWGFHKALHDLGHECVFASELDEWLWQNYYDNWGIQPHGDIRKIVRDELETIPEHDVLCAGFPCQPFSKAGKQLGRQDERGTLFDEIVKILAFRKPKYILLENVQSLAAHDNEETWGYMKGELKRLWYGVDFKVYSPHEFGIPQHRKRMFIVGSLGWLGNFDFAEIDALKTERVSIDRFIKKRPSSAITIPTESSECIDVWQEFVDRIPKDQKMPGFPIWSMESWATYPIEWPPPSSMSAEELWEFKGKFGTSLKWKSKEEQMLLLPSYARVGAPFPEWKTSFIRRNREFLRKNEKDLRSVLKKISAYKSQSWQKLEWNVPDEDRNIRNYILQFRASWLRVKKVDFFPSLVCIGVQVPIIWWENRYITKEEWLSLQSMEWIKLNLSDAKAYKALWNAVNSKIVKMVAEKFIMPNV